ncbi:unnamed protein product [Gongylonema pulchrum]|uniref:Secreted protein n=1 Tax=Gongylonema pulchrum TaxID=637853 RepID=A0A183D784_9BILA|nr:unnamed protein product [Gongylonema pulchrum]
MSSWLLLTRRQQLFLCITAVIILAAIADTRIERIGTPFSTSRSDISVEIERHFPCSTNSGEHSAPAVLIVSVDHNKLVKFPRKTE